MADIVNRIVGDRWLLGRVAGSITLFTSACCGCFLLFPTADEPEAGEVADVIQATANEDQVDRR